MKELYIWKQWGKNKLQHSWGVNNNYREFREEQSNVWFTKEYIISVFQ